MLAYGYTPVSMMRGWVLVLVAVCGCAEPVPIPDTGWATSVLVAGERAYRLDTLADQPWAIDAREKLYLLEYTDGLTWPSEPVEISLDAESGPLIPMPARWRTWDGARWNVADACCDVWQPSRWTAPALPRSACPSLRLVDTATASGDQVALWTAGVVAELAGDRVKFVRRGAGVTSRPLARLRDFRRLTEISDGVVIAWQRGGGRAWRIDTAALMTGVVVDVTPRSQGFVHDVPKPVFRGGGRYLLVADGIVFASRHVGGPYSWEPVVRISHDELVYASARGRGVTRVNGDFIGFDDQRSVDVAAVAVGISNVAEVTAVGLLAGGRYLRKNGPADTVLIRFDANESAWRAYARLSTFSSVGPLVAHAGGVLFGGREGVGFYSRASRECVVTRDLSDVAQLIDAGDGTYYARGMREGTPTYGWLVP